MLRSISLLVLTALVASVLHAQPDAWQRDAQYPGTGMITGIVETLNGTLVVGAFQDGVYTAPAFGGPWTKRTTGLTTTTISGLQMTADGSIVAGTEGGGLFRSTDAGASWTHVAGVTANLIEDMQPGPSGTIVVGTEKGVFISTVTGGTWKAVGPAQTDVWAAAFAPNGYLYCGTFDGPTYRSTDAGAHWNSMTLNQPGIATLHVAPNGTIFASSSTVFRSTDQGVTWSATSLSQSLIPVITSDASIGVVYAGGDGGVFGTVDDGATWLNIATGMESESVTAIQVGQGSRLYAGTSHGGLYRYPPAPSSAPADPAKRGGLALAAVAPNPATGPARITFTLPFAGTARVAIHDATGREAALVADEVFERGSHTVAFDASSLPGGLYFCRILTPHGITARPFVVQR